MVRDTWFAKHVLRTVVCETWCVKHSLRNMVCDALNRACEHSWRSVQFSSAIAANSMTHISGVLHGCMALSSSCPIVVSHARIPHFMSTNAIHDLARQGVFVHSISQCSRTGDAKISDAVAFGSAGWQANNAKAFHKLGGLNMRG